MIRHILMLQPSPTASAEAIEACRVALAGLVGRIPGLIDFHWGQNLGPVSRRDGLSHGFSMDFDDMASLEAYGPHPAHREAAALVTATFSRIVVFDLPLDA
jgi:hypothetical protein